MFVREEEVENFDVSSLREESLRNIEADSFWCMSRLLDGIQVRAPVVEKHSSKARVPGAPCQAWPGPLVVLTRDRWFWRGQTF
ncbi:unnamed protein product [Arctogadus glacialis]